MKVFNLVHRDARDGAVRAVESAPHGYRVTIAEPRRSLEQNAAQWPILEAFADQLEWPVNGEMTKMTREEWKDVLTAAFDGEARVAAGLNGGRVFLGQRTSKFTRAKFSQWLDFLEAVAAERGVEL